MNLHNTCRCGFFGEHRVELGLAFVGKPKPLAEHNNSPVTINFKRIEST